MKRVALAVLPVVAGAVALTACSSGAGPEFPVEVTARRVSEGRTLYMADCASCHGSLA